MPINPRYRDTWLKLIGTSFLSYSVTLSENNNNNNNKVRSYPFLVRLVQIGELKLSLGVLELCYMLEIMNRLHIDLLGKVIENLGGRFSWSTIPCLAKFNRKFNNLKDLTILGEKARFTSCVHCNPSFRHDVHHTHVVCVLKCVLFSVSLLLGDKKEAKFGGVMSVQKHSLHTQDLSCLCSILSLNNHYFCYFDNI